MDSSSSPLRCPGCQRPLEPGRAQGLCPRCLLARAGFATEADSVGPPLPVPDLAAVAAAFPQLEILELIGRGGMGIVYRARQKSLDRVVALKLLAPGRERDPAFAERFAREARALAALNHPNIVTVHDFGWAVSPSSDEASGFYFLLMEFVDGVNLRQAMRAGRFTPEQALTIVPAVCAGLQFAHERGIVHRDIKPENLLLDKEGRIKIADFGIARMLGVEPAGAGVDPASSSPEAIRSAASPSATLHTAAGTPQYMAPEQRDAQRKADHRADIYSLGVVLYELLTGELPGASLTPPSQKVQVDVRLDEVVLRALAVEPELRYATAAEFGTRLGTVVVTPQAEVGTQSMGAGRSFGLRALGVLTYVLSTLAVFIALNLPLRRPALGTPWLALLVLGGGYAVHRAVWRHRTGSSTSGVSASLWSRILGLVLLLGALVLGFAVVGQRRAQAHDESQKVLAALQATQEEESRARQRWQQFEQRTANERNDQERLQDDVDRRVLAAEVQQAVARRFSNERTMALGQWSSVGPGLLWPLVPLVLAGLWLLFRPGSGESRRDRGSAVVIAVVVCLFSGLLVVGARSQGSQGRPMPQVNELGWKPVRVEDNVVIIDVQAFVSGAPLELRAVMNGPALSGADAVLPDALVPRLPASLARSGAPAGNAPWTIAPVGRSTWQVGYVFPHAAAAEEAFRGLQPMEVGGFTFGRPDDPLMQWDVFQVIASDGVEYVGRLEARRPVERGEPSSVSVTGMRANDETSLRLTWVVVASYPGIVRIRQGPNVIDARIPDSHGFRNSPMLSMVLELVRVSDDRVRLIREFGDSRREEELSGSFAELAREMGGTTAFSARTTRAKWIELCQIEGQPLEIMIAEDSGGEASPR